MPRDSDKRKNMSKKNKEEFSESESDSEYDYIEETIRENPNISAKEINKMILDIFPLKSKKEKLQQLEKIKEFKANEKREKMKKSRKTKTKKGNKRSKPETESECETDDEQPQENLKRSFEKLKRNKYKQKRPLTKNQIRETKQGKKKTQQKERKQSKKKNKKLISELHRLEDVNKKVKRRKSKRGNKSKHKEESESDKECDDEQEWETVEEVESETDTEEEESDSDYFPENEDDELDDDELDMLKDGNMKFNIIFTTGGMGGAGGPMSMAEFNEFDDEYDFMGGGDDYYEDEDEYDDQEEYITSSDSDSECSETDTKKSASKSKSSSNKNKTKFVKDELVMVKLKEWSDFYKGTVVKVHQTKNRQTKKMEVTYDIELDDENGEEFETVIDVPSTRMKKINKESMEFEKLISEMKEIASTKKKGKKAYQKKIDQMVKAAEKHEKKTEKKETKKKKKKHMTKFKTLLKTKAPMNEFKYFNGLNIEQQKIILKKMKDLNEYDNVEKPYRLQLIESDIPVEYKSCAIKKINSLTYMDPGSGEYYKIKQWVDTFMKIPFNKHNRLPITMADGPEKCKTFMEDAKASLDSAVYGLDDAKMQIMQIVGQWISNPDSVGNAIAIQGPMGTGKTTLVKNGISKILNRPFAFLALGGATDSSFLEGHSYTYEGSSWGKIVDILLTSKCMNPVIYFDELDKISNTPKGEEIAGILTHLTDLTQNSQYHDKYFSNVDFDLSKALFIFSYNDESKVNKILLDRMYKIRTKGYDTKQKITIANDYLIPSIIKNINFSKEDIIFPNETLEYIINENTEGEKGVRNLKRALEIIYTKLNLYRLMKEDTTLFENQKTFKVEFPHTVTVENVKAFIKKNDTTTQPPFGMYL
jgi:ATP-dependent Lon protease